ncbi:MAG TPA: hypothetical protein VFR48_09450 [Solirubrobacteraceae bacterium]|nr:hypothetical protein [Solirubrobacteraceae bacterium]
MRELVGYRESLPDLRLRRLHVDGGARALDYEPAVLDHVLFAN